MPKKKKSFTSKLKSREQRKRIDFKISVSFHEYEEEHYCSSSYHPKSLGLKPLELRQKLMIASNITIECKEEKRKLAEGKYQDTKIEPILKRLHNFTNLSTEELKEINDSVRTRDRSFSKALKDVKTIHYPTLGLISDDIRTILFKFIVDQKTFPSKMDLLKELKNLANKYTNETIPIQRLVKNKLIKYQYLPECNRYLLMEHPERVYQRALYLSNIKEYRSQAREFIYVEVRRIIPRSTTSGFIAGLAAFPSSGKLEKFFTKDSAEMIAKKWLQQRILPLVPENGVIILSQPNKKNKLNPQSKKSDIIAWLDENGIPYGNETHTAELYALYNRFKAKMRQTGLYDHVFLNVGLDLLHCPADWRNLNFFRQIWADLDVMDAYHTGRPEALKQKILNATLLLSSLDTIEEKLIEDECKILMEDNKMEYIVDNVLEMVKNGDVQVLEFPKECCGDKADHFETHVSNFVYDIIVD